MVVGWCHISCRDWSLVEATCTLAFEDFFLKQKIFANDTLPKTWDFEWCETFIDQESVINSCFDLILVLIWHCYTLKYCCWTLSNWCQNMFDLIVALCFNSLIWKCPKHRPRSFLPCLLGVCHASLAIQPAAVCFDAPLFMLAFNTALYMSCSFCFFCSGEPSLSNLEHSPHVYVFFCFRNFRAFHSAAHSGTFYKGWCFSAGHVLSQAVRSSCPWKRWSMLAIPSLLGGGFIFFDFHPYLRKRSNLTNIFQMGWNHQQVYILGGIVECERYHQNWWCLRSWIMMPQPIDGYLWIVDVTQNHEDLSSVSKLTCHFVVFFNLKTPISHSLSMIFLISHQKTSNNFVATSEFPWGNLWVFPKIVVPPNHPF